MNLLDAMDTKSTAVQLLTPTSLILSSLDFHDSVLEAVHSEFCKLK